MGVKELLPRVPGAFWPAARGPLGSRASASRLSRYRGHNLKSSHVAFVCGISAVAAPYRSRKEGTML